MLNCGHFQRLGEVEYDGQELEEASAEAGYSQSRVDIKPNVH